MADLTNLASKICRAIAYYLVNEGVVDQAHCYHYFDSRERKYDGAPIVDVMLKPVGPETQFTGDDSFLVEIQVKFNAVPQPENPNADAQRLAFDALVGAVRTAMSQANQRFAGDAQGENDLDVTKFAINDAAYLMPVAPENPTAEQTLFANNNADMTDFTVLSLFQDMYGVASSEEVNWAMIQRYKVIACEAQIAGYSSPFPALPIEVVDGALEPEVDNSGNIVKWPFVDQVTGQTVYLRIVDGALTVSAD